MIVGKIGLIYIIEIIMYYLAYYIIYGRLLKRYWIPLCGLVVYYLILFFGFVGNDSLVFMVLSHLISAVVVFLLPRVSLRERITVTFMLLFVFYCVMNFMLTIIDGVILIANKGEVEVSDSIPLGLSGVEGKCFIVLLIQLVGLIGIVIIKQHISDERKMRLYLFLQKNIVLIVLFSGLFMSFTITGLDWIRNFMMEIDQSTLLAKLLGGKTKRFYYLSLCLSAFSNLSICIWGLFSIYTESMNKKMEQMIDNEKALVKMQKSYYDALLEREADTRKYRHDMINHMICLDEMVKLEKYSEVKSYIENMYDGLMDIKNKAYSVGNDIVDILTNHYASVVNPNTKVNVSGLMTCDIDPTKLCTIYSNLLQNAVEELDKCEGESELNISFSQGEKYLKICIANTLSDEDEEFHTSILNTSVLRSKGFRTSKKDKSNHGLGLRNVKKTIEDMRGTFEVSKDNGLFTAYVYLRV